MRILLIDIDSLRPDRLGCYGYHRNTSPNIDQIASQATRLEYCYASDVPCCPSRSSFLSAQYGVHHGVVAHGGERAVPWPDPSRGFIDARDRVTFPALLREHGHRCAFISSFPTRHSAWHSLAGFHDWIDTAEKGHEIAPTVFEQADQWLQKHGQEEDWYCHVTFWDAHTPYRTPLEYGDPFKNTPAPDWPDAETLKTHLEQTGMRSALDTGWSKSSDGPRQPHPIDDMEQLRAFQDGYDTAIRYIDDHVGQLLERLKTMGIADETAIVITADHGEDMGELNAYGSHCFCGPAVARIPMILRWPGEQTRVLTGLHQHFDLTATLLDLMSIPRPDSWDAQSFLSAIRVDSQLGRPFTVSSNLAQALQRAVYWQDSPGAKPHCYLRTTDAWFHPLPDEAIIEASKPYQFSEQGLEHGRQLLDTWLTQQCITHPDPLGHLQSNRGPEKIAMKEAYLKRLAAMDRV